MLRLDGAEVIGGDEAARLLGMRSAFPAKKALEQSRRLGGDRIRQAITLLAEADLDLRGQCALPAELVLEILVARLARLQRARDAGRAPLSSPAGAGRSVSRRLRPGRPLHQS